MLESALKRNERLAEETQEAACKVLKVGRVVLLESPAPLRYQPELPKPFVWFPLLNLPSELVQLVFSFIYPGALSDRQFLSVVQHAADRTTLLPKIVELQPHVQQALRRRTRAQSRLDLEACR